MTEQELKECYEIERELTISCHEAGLVNVWFDIWVKPKDRYKRWAKPKKWLFKK